MDIHARYINQNNKVRVFVTFPNYLLFFFHLTFHFAFFLPIFMMQFSISKYDLYNNQKKRDIIICLIWKATTPMTPGYIPRVFLPSSFLIIGFVKWHPGGTQTVYVKLYGIKTGAGDLPQWVHVTFQQKCYPYCMFLGEIWSSGTDTDFVSFFHAHMNHDVVNS